MNPDIFILIGFGFAMGLLLVLCWGFTLMMRDPSQESPAEKRRREKREKKEASKAE
ncbi:MAG: hypothetical protein ACREYF_23560 [Gammaproteobacteria bacterium]